ncbi:MAG: hypothetical protein ACD_79C00449G0007 [uncultured bacterium]|nr:MAG: hypothetical protein ACD_79C00449G0007 [uncultured bacterium]
MAFIKKITQYFHGHFSTKPYLKDIANNTFKNYIVLIIGLIPNFLLPIYLSQTEFGIFKSFMLFASYAGIFHLGYIDGIYLIFGGKNDSDVHVNDVSKQFSPLFYFQLLVFLITLTVSFAYSSEIIFYLSFYVFSFNLFFFYSYYLLITNQIDKNANLKIVTKIINSLALIIPILIPCFRNHAAVIISFIISTFILLFYVMVNTKLELSRMSLAKILNAIYENCKIGFFMMLSNFTLMILYSIDKLFTLKYFSIEDFSIYIFYSSFIMLGQIFLKSISEVAFAYFLKMDKNSLSLRYCKMDIILSVLWAASFVLLFPMKFMVKYFYLNYLPGFDILIILWCTVFFAAKINILHYNIYLIFKKQFSFFKITIIALIVAATLNYIFFSFYKTLTAIALATLLSYLLLYSGNIFYMIYYKIINYKSYLLWNIIPVVFLFALSFPKM